MYADRIKKIVRESTSIEHALHEMVSAFGNGRLDHLFWGYSVHLHGVARNDTLIADTFENPEFVAAFIAAGGSSNDVVGNKIASLKEPFKIDIVQLAEYQRDTKDRRHQFTETIIAHGLKSAWICILDEPWIGGAGVFNQFFADRNADSAIALEDLSEVAHTFHDEIRRQRLISKKVNLRSSQIAFLSEVAKGKSAEDLSAKYNISSRAVEMRLGTIRKSLKALNTVEAVYKATMYGILPFADTTATDQSNQNV